MTTPRPMQPSNIAGVAVVEELDVSADGATAVVARRVIRRGSYLTHLYAIDVTQGVGARSGRGASRPRRLTEGNVIDGWPRISPDGKQVAFLRSASDHGDDRLQQLNQLCVVLLKSLQIIADLFLPVIIRTELYSLCIVVVL